ncbi:hypothetical protein D3C76_1138160 [compost metagenome]
MLACDSLFQQSHQEGFVRQFGDREAGRIAVQLIVLTQQALLVDIVTAHQHADFIVMVQARQCELVSDLVLRCQIIQFTGNFTQRVDDQPVDAPGQSHGEDQRQK